MDVEMGYAGEVDNTLPGNSEGNQEINIEQNLGNAGLIAQLLVQPSHAALTVSPTYLPALSQPSKEAISSAPQNMSLVIAGYNVESNRLPSKHQRLESPPIENNKSSQVAAAQKVLLVMQNDWQDQQQHEEFEQMKKSVAWQSKTLKELQAQLNDFKKHAENAEKVNEEATGQATEVEQQLFHTRLATITERLPDPEILIEELNDKSKAWIDNHMIVDNLGVEGQSSDETDEDSDGVYTVKQLNWRNRELIKMLNGVDAVRRTTNKYGNRRPGTAPRTRKRKSARDSHPTARAPPTGKPINFYSEDWYMGLTQQEKIALKAKPALEFLTSLDDDY
ncbi:hypothetical protein BU17DRAFT_99083 [Hysterangium stoloniferum]|nr:hypothetical protein BU17DRAFT_99083 [Hysterangium stoloniferum]